MNAKTVLTALGIAFTLAVIAGCGESQSQTSKPAYVLDRTSLPIAEPKYPAVTELDARKVTPPPHFQITAPPGAPNVLIVLIDDMGFGMSSAFGGPVSMPNAERLASVGLRYNHFHTTSLCSPTRGRC